MTKRLAYEKDMTGWEHMGNAPKETVVQGCQHDRPGINYFMLWTSFRGRPRWHLIRPDSQGQKFVFDTSAEWKPAPDYWRELNVPRWSGGDGGEKLEAQEGDQILVTVGGVQYPTVIIKGVQRFIEDPNNPIVKRMKNPSRIMDALPNPNGDLGDLNDISIAYQRGAFTQREYAEFNMAIGYSVAGFCELSHFDDMDVIDPVWN